MRTYPSKLLLFGEYAIINGGNGLALPIFLFSAEWSHYNIYSEKAELSRKSLEALYYYISQKENLKELCDLESFTKDLSMGIWLDSNIPYGYGLGSSGALSAAVYDKYFKKAEHLIDIQKNLANIECHFHGASSGLDPLVAYSAASILISNKKPYIIEHNIKHEYKVYLLDTGISRNSTPLIAEYLERTKLKSFENALLRYKLLNDNCINDFLKGSMASLKENLYALSAWQKEHFDFLIPNEIKAIWAEALKQQEYIFKICGAGGGGYILIFEFTENSIKKDLHYIYSIRKIL